jgi:hypothetical protein
MVIIMISNLGVDQIVFWHRELPPPAADVVGEGEVEADSRHVAGTLANRDRLWDECLAEVMVEARTRLEQEVRRRGGRYAHVLSEGLEVKRNDATGETWLHGRFAYVMLA